MIEPTENESKETLDDFVALMLAADALSQSSPENFKDFPKTMAVSRPDEVKAARDLNTNFFQKVPSDASAKKSKQPAAA
jgi:glycine dehydrogenase subunit 2